MNRKQIRLRGEDIIKHLRLLFIVILISLSFITCNKQSNQIFIKPIDPYLFFPISLEGDKKGKVIINPQFDFAWNFSEGLAYVGTGGKYGYIDNTGKYVWNPTE